MPCPPRRIALPSVLLPAFLAACQGPGPGASQPAVFEGQEREPGPERPEGEQAKLTSLAIGCVEQGQFEAARLVLDDLVLQDSLSQARRLLDADAPESALIAIDKALGVVPDDPEVRALKADASLRLAESKIRSGGGSAGLIEGALTDAFDYYQRAGDSPHALFGASRAAWLLGRT